jgi:hypothetical protein
MTTIIVINAVSSLLAAVGIGSFLAREKRRIRRISVRPIYVTSSSRAPRPRASGQWPRGVATAR